MPRILWIDGSRGVSAASMLGALVDLGVAPSPILHALGSLGLPVELRFQTCGDGTTVHAVPEQAPMPVPVLGAAGLVDAAHEVPPAAWRVAQDAVGRLLVAEAPRGALSAAHVDAAALACVTGAAMGILELAPERVLASRVGVPEEPAPALVDLLGDDADALEFGAGEATTTDGAALLRALAAEVGAREPAWRVVVSRGVCCGEPPSEIRTGEAE